MINSAAECLVPAVLEKPLRITSARFTVHSGKLNAQLAMGFTARSHAFRLLEMKYVVVLLVTSSKPLVFSFDHS